MKRLKNAFNLEKDLFIYFSYVSPCMFQHKSDSDKLEAIVRDTNSYKNDGCIVLCGDLNARTGSDPDFIQNDDAHIPFVRPSLYY